MKRTALAVLGIALLLISFTACNPSSNNGPIVLPGGGNTPPSQGQTAQDIADALDIPALISKLLTETPSACEIEYEFSSSTPVSQMATSAGPTEVTDGITATVTFKEDYKVNEDATISYGGKIIYTILGTNSNGTFTSTSKACTITVENLKVNGDTVEFEATATITMTATIAGNVVSSPTFSDVATQSVTNAKIGETEVTITVPENPEGGTDPVEPGDDNEESQQPGTDNEGTEDSEEVAP